MQSTKKNGLIFCSFEVGGFPYKMTEILNRHGIGTLYISMDRRANGHDSTRFHYGDIQQSWDLSHYVIECQDDTNETIKKLKRLRDEYDIAWCLATGNKAWLLAEAGIEYKYWCFGSDLDYLSFISVWPVNWIRVGMLCLFLLDRIFVNVGNMKLCNIIRRKTNTFIQNRIAENDQRKSISKSQMIWIAPYQKEAALRISKKGRGELFFIPAYLSETYYFTLMREKLSIKNQFTQMYSTSTIFFSSARHFWHGRKRRLSDNKGNDILLLTYSKFLSKVKDKDSKLILVRKGPDVIASEEMIARLNLSDNVIWVDEMPIGKLTKYYMAATVCFGQFGTPVLTYSASEPLMQATPSISWFLTGRENDVPWYAEDPPIFNSNDPAEIADYLIKLCRNRGFYVDQQRKSWLWAKRYCSERTFVQTIREW